MSNDNSVVKDLLSGTIDSCEALQKIQKDQSEFGQNKVREIIESFVDMIHKLDHSIDDFLRAQKTLRIETKNVELSESQSTLFVNILASVAQSLMNLVDLHRQIQNAFTRWYAIFGVDVLPAQTKWPTDVELMFEPLTSVQVPEFADSRQIRADPVAAWGRLQKATDSFVNDVQTVYQNLALAGLQTLEQFQVQLLFQKAIVKKYSAFKKVNLKQCGPLSGGSKKLRGGQSAQSQSANTGTLKPTSVMGVPSYQLTNLRNVLFSILESTKGQQFGFGAKDYEKLEKAKGAELYKYRKDYNDQIEKDFGKDAKQLKLEWSDFDLSDPIVKAAQNSSSFWNSSKSSISFPSFSSTPSKPEATVSEPAPPKTASPTKTSSSAPESQTTTAEPQGLTFSQRAAAAYESAKQGAQAAQAYAQQGASNVYKQYKGTKGVAQDAQRALQEQKERDALAARKLQVVNAQFAAKREAQDRARDQKERDTLAAQKLQEVNAQFAAKREAQQKAQEQKERDALAAQKLQEVNVQFAAKREGQERAQEQKERKAMAEQKLQEVNAQFAAKREAQQKAQEQKERDALAAQKLQEVNAQFAAKRESQDRAREKKKNEMPSQYHKILQGIQRAYK